MRLKKLVLNGFKSFADRTEFVFDSPITGIVGPNGCGKSNVVDAFKWVLGEQSAKSLRGDAMMDVIFNGSSVRKAAGMAEVVLVFDNPLREDGTRLLNVETDEVAVGRRLFRDGTSEYQLNNASSRLKDVRELFLDTGVGVDAYSVIEQGRVAALLEANPAERRLIFEEAAGISKFKAKKKEAVRKLEKVDQNLLRVNDIVEEVERRLRSVKIQAGKARSYNEYSTRLRELRLQYALQEYHQHATQVAELEGKRNEAAARLEEISTALAGAQNELALSRQEFDQLSQARQRTEHQLVQAKADVQSAQQRQQFAAQQLEQIAEQLAQFEEDKRAIEEKAGEVESHLAEQSGALDTFTAELNEHREAIARRQEEFRAGQHRLNQTVSEIDRNKNAILDLMRRLAQTNSRLGAIEIERKNLAAQQERVAQRRRVVVEEIEGLAAKRRELDEKLEAAKFHIGMQQRALEERRQEASLLGQQISQISEQLGAAREHRSALVSRQRLLQDLEAKREGVSEGVKSVLRQREEKFSFIRGLVADVLRVDVEHASVIEAALDGRDQLLVAESLEAVVAARVSFEELEGRVNVLVNSAPCITGVPPVLEIVAGAQSTVLVDHDGSHGRDARDAYDWNQHPQRIRLAIDLVRFEPGDAPIAEHLLGKTVIVDDLAAASDLHENGPVGFRYVTGAGEVIEADGTFRAGPLTAAMGLLSRRSELEAIGFQIAEVDGRIAELSHRLTEGNTQAKTLEAAQNELRNAIYQASETKVELTSAIAQNHDRQSSLHREQPLLERELAAFLETVGKLAGEETKLAENKAAMEGEQAQRQQKVEELVAEQKQIEESLRAWGEELTAKRVLLGQVQEKQLAAQQQVQRLTAARAELGQQIQRIAQSAEALAGRRGGVERELAAAQEREQVLEAQQKQLADAVEELEQKVADVAKVVQTLTGRVESTRGEHGEVEQELHQLQMKVAELRVRLESSVQRTLEELQIDLPARYAEAQAQEGGYVPADMNWEAVAEEIKELREKIHRLGNVNVEAIAEQDELEQRSNFLQTQLTDLAESKRQLTELIDTINLESGVRFEQTFTAVREHFAAMFRKIFGGGAADLVLETEVQEKEKREVQQEDGSVTLIEEWVTKKVDVLDAGIEIIARPPGKKPVSISQLSGGEKAMTCISLLMSIFKSKPSPFCILDEVDAPLDEANNQRFGMLIQEFLETSQFIVITHHKRTMQIADVLYGVTMQEQGVSKRVAVKFDQVDNQGRINEHAAA
jgi:chromosome segregation protein